MAMTTATKQCNEIPPFSNKELIANQILAIKNAFQTLTLPSAQDKEPFTLMRSQFEAFFSDKFIKDLNLLDDYKIVNHVESELGFIPALSFNSDKIGTKIFLRIGHQDNCAYTRIILNYQEWDHVDWCFDIPNNSTFTTRQQYLIASMGEFLAITAPK